MSEMKHTPGPWQFEVNEFGTVIAKDGYSIGSAFGSRAITGGELPHEANARLIAAAPDMLEALRKALNYLQNTEGEFGVTFESADACRAAIAKAEGAS